LGTASFCLCRRALSALLGLLKQFFSALRACADNETDKRMARARVRVLFFYFPFGVPLRYTPMRQEKTNTLCPIFISFSE
jgi:hypothetical protein